MRGYGGTAVICELIDSVGGMHNTIKVGNTGTIPALDISIDSTTSEILWDKDAERTPDEPRNLPGLFDRKNYVLDPPYLPIRSLPSGSDVILRCWCEWGNPQQDVLQVTWRTPDGQVHRNEQSWSWTPRRPSLMPKVTASSPRSVSVSVSLNWQRRGEAVAYFPANWEEVPFFWPSNFVSTRPGLYRITVMDADFRPIYIGESDRLSRRLGDYTRIYRLKPDSTPSRLTFLIRKALVRGHPVYLDTASTGKITIEGSERRLEMSEKAQRLLAEAAAVLQEEDLAGDDDNAWILNKHLDDKRYRRFISTSDLLGT